ncbi:hypothetical protein PTSG_01767 [Salpingoeca rosetta]|uniref:Uncharacterized protein n=1 Tax=Salpingoeca rosetta (strain ATCC 50818 / BSB-021) TaxID=946362 RepID=F2TYW7_SALR5|nr:uncharacterized protein PTSG_01767 [Salpingoeca rosetta]EGD78791.1 hypothetical protein PTSG_01767 [Salpingoeca rosetta]|eukprot:XP_004997747.1 hypothetical protein PTSG_01767 [Salpingoeca rosetta]
MPSPKQRQDKLQADCRSRPQYSALNDFIGFYYRPDLAVADIETLVEPLPEELQNLAASLFKRHADDMSVEAPTQEEDPATPPYSTLEDWKTLDVSGRYISSKFRLPGQVSISSLEADLRQWMGKIPAGSVLCLNLSSCTLLDDDLEHVTTAVQLLLEENKTHKDGLIVVLRGARIHKEFDELRRLLEKCSLVDICDTPMASANSVKWFRELHAGRLLHKLNFINSYHNLDASLRNLFGDGEDTKDIKAEAAKAFASFNHFNNPPLHARTVTRLYWKNLHKRLGEVRLKADKFRAQKLQREASESESEDERRELQRRAEEAEGKLGVFTRGACALVGVVVGVVLARTWFR